MVILAAVALATVSVITVAVAATPAHNDAIGEAIDQVNLHNDCTAEETP